MGNYAELSANILSMIYSEATFTECYASNSMNNLGLMFLDINNVESGLVNMNY